MMIEEKPVVLEFLDKLADLMDEYKTGFHNLYESIDVLDSEGDGTTIGESNTINGEILRKQIKRLRDEW